MLFCIKHREVPDTNDHGSTGSTNSNGNSSSNQDQVIILFATSPNKGHYARGSKYWKHIHVLFNQSLLANYTNKENIKQTKRL